MIRAAVLLAAALALSLAGFDTEAKSGSRASSGKSAKSSTFKPGTGAKSSSSSVRGYTKKNGTYVAPHKRSTPDTNARNNFSTKGNTNPYNGKRGTQDVPPGK